MLFFLEHVDSERLAGSGSCGGQIETHEGAGSHSGKQAILASGRLALVHSRISTVHVVVHCVTPSAMDIVRNCRGHDVICGCLIGWRRVLSASKRLFQLVKLRD